jgi:hypothetical protein
VRDAIAKDVYKGVEFHNRPGGAVGTSLEAFVASEGIGTDLAPRFARSVFCARLPIAERMLGEVPS